MAIAEIPKQQSIQLILVAWLMLAWLGLFTSCAEADHLTPLRVGSNLWIGYGPFYLAQTQGLYSSDASESIHLIQMPSASDVLHAFRSDRLETAAVTLDEALRLADEGIPFKIVLLIDFSNGADVLLGGSQIKSLSQLAGKRVGVEDGATGAILLHHALQKIQLTPAEIRIVPLTVDKHREALLSGQVDAVVTFEPMRSQLLAAGAHLLFDSSQAPDSIVDLLIVKPEALQSLHHRAALTMLIRGYFSILDRLHKDPADLVKQAAADFAITPKQFEQALTLIKQPGKNENCALLCGKHPPFQQTLQRVTDIMVARSLLQNSRFEQLIADDFVAASAP